MIEITFPQKDSAVYVYKIYRAVVTAGCIDI